MILIHKALAKYLLFFICEVRPSGKQTNAKD